MLRDIVSKTIHFSLPPVTVLIVGFSALQATGCLYAAAEEPCGGDSAVDMSSCPAEINDNEQLAIKDGTASLVLPSIQFSNYISITSEFDNLSGWSSDPAYWSTIQFPDLNADGKSDVCGRSWQGIVCALSAGTSWGPVSLWTASFSDQDIWASHPSYYETIRFPDVNGDGKADVCGRGIAGIYCALRQPNSNSFGPLTLWASAYSDANLWKSHPSYYGTIQFADLNADGKDDVCGRGIDGTYCGLSNGSAFATSKWTPWFDDAGGWSAQPAYWETIQLPRVTSGGADICGRASSGIFCGKSTGTSFNAATQWTSWFNNADGWNSDPKYWSTIRFPDVSGSGGLADVCGRSASGIFCGVSNGGAFNTPTQWTTGFKDADGWGAHDYYYGTIQYPDLNNDGRADVCGRGSGGIFCGVSSGVAFVNMTHSTPNVFTDASGWSSHPSYYKTIQFPDVNGDGNADVCGRRPTGILCGINTL